MNLNLIDMGIDNKKEYIKPELYKESPTVFNSVDEAVIELGLSKKVKWKTFNNELCRYTKKSLCPEFVIKNGMPVLINVE